MSLLQALGIDITVLFQLGIAAISFLILALTVFKPFQSAYLARLKNTLGSAADTEEVAQKIQIVQQTYEQRVKELHAKIAEIFALQKKAAAEAHAQKIKEAQQKVELLRQESEATLQKYKAEYSSKKETLSSDLSSSIYERLVTKVK